ncbi:MAG: hypothetical protein OEZ58_10645 [Gammaproteobacteria bacterium]|nr:hypothetical protein [Gammaproteobacteria bacterium]
MVRPLGETQSDIFKLYYQRFPVAFRFGSFHALLRATTIKHLVNKLYSDSKFTHQTYERLNRTRSVLRQIIWYGVDSEQGRQSIAHMNRSHQNLNVSNEDYCYILGLFFLEPLRWNRCFDQNKMQSQAIQAIIDFWVSIGERMHINIAMRDYAQWQHFQQSYENEFLCASEYAHQLAIQTLQETPRMSVPIGFRYWVKQALLATADPIVLDCLALPHSRFRGHWMVQLLDKGRMITVNTRLQPPKELHS